MRKSVFGILIFLLVIFTSVSSASADESSWGPPKPGAAIKGGGGAYYSVPCGCIDRGLWDTEVTARMHFGWRGTLETGLHRGAMLLGGRFPSNAWSLGAMMTIPSEKDRWWERISVRAGYRHWRVMGMRSQGTHGMYASLNWAVEILPYVHLEADALTGRTFRVMPHWEFGGRLGISTRF